MDLVFWFLLLGGGDLIWELVKRNQPGYAVLVTALLIVGGLVYTGIEETPCECEECDCGCKDKKRYVVMRRKTIEQMLNQSYNQPGEGSEATETIATPAELFEKFAEEYDDAVDDEDEV